LNLRGARTRSAPATPEKQPLVNQRGNLVITADCRIDNRDELISALQYDKYPAEKITDAQLILGAYEKWGEACPEYLLGISRSLFGMQGEQTLFCARDHYGVKPFHYYISPHIFVFASEIKALLSLPQIPQEINETKVGHFLISFLSDNNSTLYKNIFRLPAGHSITVNNKGTNIVITHRFSLAMRADIIHVMKSGRIVESGNHDELISQNGFYAQSWRQQM
jgi:asparagine synthase (glutamine-hydrolysing)